jgi:hypothetical protein
MVSGSNFTRELYPQTEAIQGVFFPAVILIESTFIGDMLTFRFTNSTCVLQNSFYLPRAYHHLTLPHTILSFTKRTEAARSGSRQSDGLVY